ncbi:hypothetical protein O181_111407, partial [Austropuccinia psidii MF-1]|nr:hypothetical protein [Austropuccinia psidii MF-1]
MKSPLKEVPQSHLRPMALLNNSIKRSYPKYGVSWGTQTYPFPTGMKLQTMLPHKHLMMKTPAGVLDSKHFLIEPE